MSLLLYAGATVLGTSIATSLATKAVTSAPNILAGALTRTGITNYFATAKSSYRDYYKRMVTEGPLFEAVMEILSKNADKAYGMQQDPRKNKTYLEKLAGNSLGIEEHWISSDILCFRNSTGFYDYSAYGRARVRFYYDGKAVVMCQKKSELEDFCKKIVSPDFDISTSLVFVGVG